jgi:DNA-directed RNA polymerase
MIFSRWLIRRSSSATNSLFEGARVEYPEFVQPLTNIPTVQALENASDQLLNDRLAYIFVLLKNRNFVKAETAFSKLWRSNYGNFRKEYSVKTINAFIEAHMVAEDYKAAMHWYKHITENSLNPNLETFAIVASYFVRVNQMDRLPTLVDRMKLYDLDPTALLEDPRFQSIEERTILETLLNDMGFSTQAHELDSLLLTAIADSKTTKITSTLNTKIVKEEEETTLNSSSAAKGIQLLAQSLAKFKNAASFEDKLAMQHQLEEECQRLAILESNMDKGNLPEHMQQLTDIPKNLMIDWFSKMVPIIEHEIKELEKEKSTFVEYMKILPATQLALLTITSSLRSSTARNNDLDNNTFGSFKSAEFFMEIGSQVEKEVMARAMLKDPASIEMTNRIHEMHVTGQLQDKTIRAAAKRLTRIQSLRVQRMKVQWSDEIRFKIGSKLTDILLGVAKVTAQVPSEIDPTIME